MIQKDFHHPLFALVLCSSLLFERGKSCVRCSSTHPLHARGPGADAHRTNSSSAEQCSDGSTSQYLPPCPLRPTWCFRSPPASETRTTLFFVCESKLLSLTFKGVTYGHGRTCPRRSFRLRCSRTMSSLKRPSALT